VKHRTIQVKAFGASSVTMERYITVEMLTGSFLGVPWSPWLFPRYDFGVQERIDRGFGVGAHSPMTTDVCHALLLTARIPGPQWLK